jgi:hypothetical protein
MARQQRHKQCEDVWSNESTTNSSLRVAHSRVNDMIAYGLVFGLRMMVLYGVCI